ncbi:hypothetical protein D7D52_08110 [Nocardia yunnanensis]|uniref:Prenyltransferase n=1 Tax=Nocardia yunnanensis TaxID=2382165 RepID=A0A386Z9Q0_9NOCA|nr:hypothetical protein [Nocardia yunnanensis]AYF73834.1 hypothetical protein D7D52_08110 [Nocardia yunnanensis]
MTDLAENPVRAGVLTSLGRIARFTRVMYKPHYLLYGILWVFALEGSAALLTQPGTGWSPTGATAARIAAVAIVLLYLRMVDEQKDLAYDRVHNPDRPLVTGAVSALELRGAMAVIALVAIAGSLALSVRSALAIAAVLAYGLVLWGLEQLSATVRTNILLNLLVTYPVQLLVTLYVVVSAIDTGQAAAHGKAAWLAVVFAGAFLQFEFARKTSRSARPGEMYYSNALGPNGCAVASVLFAVAAVVCEIIVMAPWERLGATEVLGWIPVALTLVPVFGAVRFLRSGDDEYPILPAVLFILALYLTLIAQAVVATHG